MIIRKTLDELLIALVYVQRYKNICKEDIVKKNKTDVLLNEYKLLYCNYFK